MNGTRRWVLIIVTGLVIVGLVAFARGPDHHRGQQVGVRALGGDRAVSVAIT